MGPADWRSFWAGRGPKGRPIYPDRPVLAAWVEAESGPSRIVLDVADADGTPLGRAYVFDQEWYPGCPAPVRFSHYFRTLQRALRGLKTLGSDPPRLRLQVLKAVDAGRTRPYIVLLKFILCPEYGVWATHLEWVYRCPLQGFYRLFVGVPRAPTAPPSLDYTVGNATHAGYRRAARAVIDGRPDEAPAEYFRGVAEAWLADFPALVRHDPNQIQGWVRTIRMPWEHADRVIASCRARFGAGPAAVLHERPVFAPDRGLGGRVDRIIIFGDGIQVVEVKTSAGPGVSLDPLTGRQVPGGVQALAYHEAVRLHNGAPPETLIEFFDGSQETVVPLSDHPVIRRAGARPRQVDDRYLDLVAQNRNQAFVAASGLLTGYDRQLLNQLPKEGHRLRGTGGDFDFQADSPPCRSCPAGQRGVCEQNRADQTRRAYDFWLYIPPALFAYWAWFHRQLKAEERLEREHLFKLATADPAILEAQEGITLGGLQAGPVADGRVRLGRANRLETRLREDDRVLVTPAPHRPGHFTSVRGVIRRLETFHLEVDLDEPHLPPAPEYRVDRMGLGEQVDWEIEGLTDFMLNAMAAAGVRGRRVRENELPALARAILGSEHLPAPVPAPCPLTPVLELSPSQLEALRCILGLGPGELLLVQGPPGTGKTALIAEAARQLFFRYLWDPIEASDPRPVLVLANTHRAANEVVLKLLRSCPELEPFIVRVGRVMGGMEPEVAACVLSERVGFWEAVRTGTDLEGRLKDCLLRGALFHRHAGIFVGTLAAAAAPELQGLIFRHVIVDEAGQATEPATLQALRRLPPGFNGALVLVGDHCQLPPVVQSAEFPPLPPELTAGRGFRPDHSLKVSLFERLAERYPQRLIRLTEQYRMARPISDLVGETFYGGNLRPATPAVAGQPPPSPFDRHVIWVLTDGIPEAAEQTAGPDETRSNPFEADLAARVVVRLVRAGLPPDRVGAVSPYRRQNTRVRQAIADLAPDLADRVRVDTVDRFQGGERDAIVISLTASNPERSLGELLADWRRLNVAVSRARRLVVLIGSRETLTEPGPADSPEARVAKGYYRRLWAGVRRLAEAGRARIVHPDDL
jgi:hypothetical protein